MTGNGFRPFVTGDTVLLSRNEKRYPARGVWKELRGRTGTVVAINRDSRNPDLTEYGVALNKLGIMWCKGYEIQLTTNTRETALTRRDKAYQTLRDLGMSDEEIKAETGVSV